jgi:hypothetical protein
MARLSRIIRRDVCEEMIEVYLDDAECKNFSEADRWARECCDSYRGVDVQDVSDVSYVADEIAVYVFGNSADAAMFTMRWKGNDR